MGRERNKVYYPHDDGGKPWKNICLRLLSLSDNKPRAQFWYLIISELSSALALSGGPLNSGLPRESRGTCHLQQTACGTSKDSDFLPAPVLAHRLEAYC